MNRWQKMELQKLGGFFKGFGIPRDSVDSGSLPAVRYGELYTNYNTFVTGKTRSTISNKIADDSLKLQYGDILFAGSGETSEDIGKSAAFLLSEGYAGGDIIVFRPDKTKVDPKFLAYYFETRIWKKQRRRAAQGQSIVHIHVTDLKKMITELPDLETQQKIVQVLEAWDSCIDKVEKLVKHEKDKLRWLTYKLVCNKENTRTEKLCSLAKITTGKKDVNQGCDNGKYPFFTCAKEHTWSNDYSFDGEAICIAGNGEIGKSFYYNGKFEAYQRTYVLTDFIISGQYLNYVIKSLFKEMVEHQKQMSAMPYIKLETLKNFVVPVPDNQEIDKIIEILNDEDNIVSTYENILYTMDLQKTVSSQPPHSWRFRC